jgi:hypothetical protein
MGELCSFDQVHEYCCLLVRDEDQNGQCGHKLTTHLHLVPRLIMVGAIPPLRHMRLDYFTFPLRCGAESCEHRNVRERLCSPVHS